MGTGTGLRAKSGSGPPICNGQRSKLEVVIGFGGALKGVSILSAPPDDQDLKSSGLFADILSRYSSVYVCVETLATLTLNPTAPKP